MEDEGAVPEEGADPAEGGGVVVRVRVCVGARLVDAAVLAGEITDLAGFRGRGVAGRGLPSFVWVEMSQGLCAVAICRHRLAVNVVDWFSVRFIEAQSPQQACYTYGKDHLWWEDLRRLRGT